MKTTHCTPRLAHPDTQLWIHTQQGRGRQLTCIRKRDGKWYLTAWH